MADNLSGPADRSVPVLRIDAPDGTLRAVLFGCACHNTSLTGRDNAIAGDYAGFAQEFVQSRRPGVQAMFVSGCGADATPTPTRRRAARWRSLASTAPRWAVRSVASWTRDSRRFPATC